MRNTTHLEVGLLTPILVSLAGCGAYLSTSTAREIDPSGSSLANKLQHTDLADFIHHPSRGDFRCQSHDLAAVNAFIIGTSLL